MAASPGTRASRNYSPTISAFLVVGAEVEFWPPSGFPRLRRSAIIEFEETKEDAIAPRRNWRLRPSVCAILPTKFLDLVANTPITRPNKAAQSAVDVLRGLASSRQRRVSGRVRSSPCKKVTRDVYVWKRRSDLHAPFRRVYVGPPSKAIYLGCRKCP